MTNNFAPMHQTMKGDCAMTIEHELKKGLRKQGSELQPSDVGRSLDHIGAFGIVHPADIGKRVWRKHYGLVMENAQQRNARKGLFTCL
jgi:hypothetical protein